MAGGGVVPNPLLAQLIRSGAKVVPLPTPCAETEARYRPSVGLQRFVPQSGSVLSLSRLRSSGRIL